ncbi:MAG: copper amine oxidase N-terminal domain-containing protein [Vulcanimicrobiaceae bacterium]
MNLRIRTLAAIAAGAIALALAGRAWAQETPAPDFGSPPSGEIPILFNDHHVYANPDREKHNRVLAAIVRDGTILVPLRSMFEQMGATVSYDPSTKAVDVTKPGADVKVTVGVPQVVINGETRPLDVPPEIYQGTLVVPVRVISEGMGAYVQWLPDRRIVVVRYIPAAPPSPPPTEAPTATPTEAPTPTPAPTAAPQHNETFVAGDYLISPKVYDELSPGNTGTGSYEVRAAREIQLGGTTLEIGGDYRHLHYPHNAALGAGACLPGAIGCNTVVGQDPIYQPGPCPAPDPGCVTTVGFTITQAQSGLGQIYVPSFNAYQDSFQPELGLRVGDPRIYLAVGGYFKRFQYLGYPNISGVGFGIDKLPDLDHALSIYGSVFYYPNVSGTYTFPTSIYLGTLSGTQIPFGYRVLDYRVGLSLTLGKFLFVEGGFSGEHANAKANAPSDTSLSAPYAGLGIHF